MGVITVCQEVPCSASAARMFKAMVVDSHNFLPKLLPQAFKSIQFIQGDGGVGSISQRIYVHDGKEICDKHRIDALDTANYSSKYTLFEGAQKAESVEYDVKYEPSGAGCVCKVTMHCHVKGDELKEEDIEVGKQQLAGLYKVVDDYLVANPDVYA